MSLIKPGESPNEGLEVGDRSQRFSFLKQALPNQWQENESCPQYIKLKEDTKSFG